MATDQQRPELHSRSKSGFSFRSHKSSGSADKIKVDLRETEKERNKSKFSGKTHVNPNRAIQEAQPSVRAQEAVTLNSFRGGQYLDWQGNVIIDPDSTNPLRPKMERPLDTIRSFEAAVDGTHSRKTSNMPARSKSADASEFLNFDSSASRRTSVVGTDVNVNFRSPAAIPGAPLQPTRSYIQRDPYAQSYNSRGPPNSYNRRAMPQRLHSAPSFERPYSRGGGSNSYNGYDGYYNYPNQPSYSYHGHNDSYDTTADSTGSPSEPWANSTDPSSENSSLDRIHATKYADASNTGDAYGVGNPGGYQYPGTPGYGRSSPPKRANTQPIAEESWHADRGYEGEPYDQQGPPYQSGSSYQQQRRSPQQASPGRGGDPGMRPPPPPSQMNRSFGPASPSSSPQRQQDAYQHQPQRNVIPLGGGGEWSRPQQQQQQSATAEQVYKQPQSHGRKTLEKKVSNKDDGNGKKKSWLKRRFSKG